MAKGFEKWPNFRDLMIIAKELKFKQNVAQELVYERLISFCNDVCPNFDHVLMQKLAKKCVDRLKTTENYSELPEKIVFYKEEIEEIAKISNKEQQKLVFIMCCLCKFRKNETFYLNSKNSIKLSDVFALAKVKIPQKNQEMKLHELKKAGLISVDMRPILRVHISCLKTSGNKQLEFAPNNEMIENLYTFESVAAYKCKCCGKMVKRTGQNSSYCKECARKVNIQKTIERRKLRRAIV